MVLCGKPFSKTQRVEWRGQGRGLSLTFTVFQDHRALVKFNIIICLEVIWLVILELCYTVNVGEWDLPLMGFIFMSKVKGKTQIH